MNNFEEVKQAAIQLGYAMAGMDALKFSTMIGGERGVGADMIVKHLEIKLKEMVDESNNSQKETKSTTEQ